MTCRVRRRSRPVSDASAPVGSDKTPASPTPSAGECIDDYEVGYRKPPRNTRFKSGQSGNPKGRPKGSKNLKALIDRELNTKIAVREGGACQQVSKRGVVAKRLVNKALEGQDRAIATLVKMDEELDAASKACQAAGNAASRTQPLAKDDRAILAELETRILEKHGLGADEAGDQARRTANDTEETSS